MSSLCTVEEGLDGPINNFVFRQCPAEFKLKVAIGDSELNWAVEIETTSTPPKTSLLQISHSNGLIIFPHHEKGSLAFAPLKDLAQIERKNNNDQTLFDYESLAFPGDESFILSLCIDPSENLIFIAKASKKLYAVDLGKIKGNGSLGEEFKKPVVSKISQLDAAIVQCVASESHGLWVLLETGKLENFNYSNEETLLRKSEISLDDVIKVPIGCISPIKNGIFAVGAKETSEIFIMNLEFKEPETFKSKMINFTVPSDALNCGNSGISSIFLISSNGNSLLFSCTPDNLETDNVPLILAENYFMDENSLKLNSNEINFSYFFDPCASRPPRQNQFYFLTLPVSNWSENNENLVDLVVLSNFSSPDIGICGRLGLNEPFQTFFIDNDEGLAQLPFENGKVTYPLGISLDLSSKIPLENLNDPKAKPFPPAPILWILTNFGHLCPFSMLKTDETTEHSFMRLVPNVKFEAESKKKEIEPLINELPSETSSSVKTISDEFSVINPVKLNSSEASIQMPLTPSKVPVNQLHSLQKSTSTSIFSEIQSPPETFNFKSAPTVATAGSSTSQFLPSSAKTSNSIQSSSVSQFSLLPTKTKTSESQISLSLPSSSPMNTSVIVPKIIEEPFEIELIKKEEQMEAINAGPYKNILLSEIAATHTSMQEDLFMLKQISLKNSMVIRQNSQKYFSSLESLETYSQSLEKLLNTSDKIFGTLKDRLEELRGELRELLVKTGQVKSTWSRIKQDNKINWEQRLRTLSTVSQELFSRIDRLHNFLNNPSEALKYRATFQSFIDSTHEKIQLLMAYLSNLFVSQTEEISTVYADFGALSLSNENLFDQFNGLSIKSDKNYSDLDLNTKRINRNKSLLNAVKSRGARLIIPNAPKKFTPSVENQIPKLNSIDESLISSFISAINLTDEVPEFPEISKLAQLSLNNSTDQSKSTKSLSPSLSSTQTEASASPSKSSSISPTFALSTAADSSSYLKPALSVSSPISSLGTVASIKAPSLSSGESESKSSLFSFKSTTAPTLTSIETSSEISKLSLTSDTSKLSLSSSISTMSPQSDSIKSLKDNSSISETSFRFKIPESTTLESKETIKEISKIPSIFTSTSTLTPIESVLSQECPLASFDSLNFETISEESSSKTSLNETKSINSTISTTPKKFPSIFGVKSDDADVSKNTISSSILNSPPVKTDSLLISQPKESSPSPSFSFAPNISSEESKGSQPTPIKSTFSNVPLFGSTSINANASVFGATTTPITSTLGNDSKFGSFSSAKSPVISSSNLTSIPSFNFGQKNTNLQQSTPSAPAFGQTSLPSTGFGFGFSSSSTLPAPSDSVTAGFAAFAAQSSTGFSSFSSVANPNSSSLGPESGSTTGLTFASFLPAENKKSTNDQSKPSTANSTNPSSTFSFSGFRE